MRERFLRMGIRVLKAVYLMKVDVHSNTLSMHIISNGCFRLVYSIYLNILGQEPSMTKSITKKTCFPY